MWVNPKLLGSNSPVIELLYKNSNSSKHGMNNKDEHDKSS